jgi:hypothetical protein
MTDREKLDKARAMFTGATQGDTLAREVIAIAEQREHTIACILGADCDRLLAMRAQEILDRIGTGRPSVWDESLCQSCGKKLEDPQSTTRCAPCAAARNR